MFSKKAIRIICIVTAVAIVIPMGIGIVSMFMNIF